MNEITKKQALRMIEYGVFVITAKAFNHCFGSTVTWLTQTSFKPPLIMVALKVGSGIYSAVKESRCFAVHLLSKEQESFAADFFKSSESDDFRINGHPYKLSEKGNPLLDNPVAIIECTVNKIIEDGDHHIVVGKVVNTQVKAKTSVLSLRDTDWTYGG